MGYNLLGGPVAVSSTAGPTVKSIQTLNTSSNLFLSAGSFYTAASFQQISTAITITCGPSGIIVLDYSFVGVCTVTSTPLCITAAQSTTDAALAHSVGVATELWVAATSGYNISVSGQRVVSGMGPGTNYTFAVYASTNTGSAIYYSYVTDQTYQTKPSTVLKVTTY